MPELPEVETIKNGLAPHLTGLKFTGVKIRDTRPVQEMDLDEFCARLIGREVLGLERRGKYMIIRLSEGENLIVHLRMTGALLWDPRGKEPFTRVEFHMNNGGRLVYSDVRRFGTIYLTRHPEKIVGKLGVEPLSGSFTPSALARLLHTHNAPVKSVLLNQELIAGIGNMYADEALFAAKIHPQRPASSLKQNEIKSLHQAIVEVLEKGIRNKGASIRNYRCADGEAGRAHEEFAVAHREGEKCPRCGKPIVRIVVGQRGTHFCPHCQVKKWPQNAGKIY
jgi:formamidopyrimidine-DNA glycosylase